MDDTAGALDLFHWAGLPADDEALAAFEGPDDFFTYPHETHPSLGANLRVLCALRDSTCPRREAWSAKALAMVRRYAGTPPWFDKWHISPYYLGDLAGRALLGVADDLLGLLVHWVRATQRPDGGWGYYGCSTAEETAFGLLTLLAVRRVHGPTDPDALGAAARFLAAHAFEPRRTPLWVNKVLYHPKLVVDAVEAAALHAYLHDGGG